MPGYRANSRRVAIPLPASLPLRERAKADAVALESDHAFVDEGYSGSTLVRPALESLRDAVAGGRIDRIYILAPDRLARRYAYQVLLVEEFRRAGAEVVFLNRTIGGSAEDDLLLQVQGVIAEYERAKILERGRRGRRHAAQDGAVSALSGAPYGYRYIGRHGAAGSHVSSSAKTKPASFDRSSAGSVLIVSVCVRSLPIISDGMCHQDHLNISWTWRTRCPADRCLPRQP